MFYKHFYKNICKCREICWLVIVTLQVIFGEKHGGTLDKISIYLLISWINIAWVSAYSTEHYMAQVYGLPELPVSCLFVANFYKLDYREDHAVLSNSKAELTWLKSWVCVNQVLKMSVPTGPGSFSQCSECMYGDYV